MGRLFGVPDDLPLLHDTVRLDEPIRIRPAHVVGCGCLACADWRQQRRVTGDRSRWPQPAKDWRGVEFVP